MNINLPLSGPWVCIMHSQVHVHGVDIIKKTFHISLYCHMSKSAKNEYVIKAESANSRINHVTHVFFSIF